MKLQTQLTVAFTTLLVVTMLFVTIAIHSLLLDVLIQNEKDQLAEKGELLAQFLYSEVAPRNFSDWLNDEEVYLFIYNRANEQVMLYSSSLEVSTIETWVNRYDLTNSNQPLWSDGKTEYVVSILPIYPELLNQELVLITPLGDLQAVQSVFFNRLVIVFMFGVIVIAILSHYLTMRLVTPLTQLKHQLKKVEKRQFDSLERIKATGEIKEVEESMVDMARALERYMKSQQQFFQNASHELKTPLMTIQGYAEGIKDGVFTGEEEARGLEVMTQEIARLKKIINEMILLAKLDSDETIYHDETIYISHLIQQAIDRAIPLATDQQIALNHKVIDDLTVVVDEEKVLRALMNIITNAIRHAKTQVLVEARHEQGRLYITVDDDGEGIDEALMPQLFDRFIKGKDGETGLGLAISRAIIERSNGTIEVADSPIGGARFTIIL